ncbi:LLM class F420-dependent oxidoreductase [Actinomadura sp. SCN-SB]|uniref:LLM class F420-dependent oxidoreductase n=1 Tax=Actinomadura sp. SCN-SB TaxID=3373092 RepID=UPI0037538A80
MSSRDRALRITVDYPVSEPGYDPELLTPDGMREVAQAAERAGLDAIAFTDHPAPSQRWLDAGGHEALDVPSALSFCAAVTERLRLMSYLLVLPYRNPFLTAKSVATVDVLSGGRMTLVAGGGYMKSEFRALGVPFEQRNELFDEALEVLRGVWSHNPYEYKGRHFQAEGVAALPRPVQKPGGPPIWIGGNSARARRRAAEHQGWSPLIIDETLARTTRTPALSSVGRLAAAVAELRELAAAAQGVDTRVDVQVQTPYSRWSPGAGSAEEHRDHLGRLAEAGATWFVLRPPGSGVQAAVESLHAYGDLVGGL